MRCPSCSAENPDGSAFCNACGANLTVAASPAPPSPQPAVPPAVPPGMPSPLPSATRRLGANTLLIAIIGGVVLICAIIGIVLIVVFD